MYDNIMHTHYLHSGYDIYSYYCLSLVELQINPAVFYEIHTFVFAEHVIIQYFYFL